MRYVVLTSNSFFSYLLLSHLLPRHRARIALVVELRGVGKGKGLIATLRGLRRKMGLRGFAYKLGTAAYGRALDKFSLLPWVRRSYSPLTLARRLGIEVVSYDDANGAECLRRLRAETPDLVFAINVYQRLKAAVLGIPRIGVVNMHFGMLPNYRGMSPYMWALARGEREVGLTAHFMDEEFDTGDIIRQERIEIQERDSVFAVYVRGCLTARRVLAEIADDGLNDTIQRRSQPRAAGSYFSMPGRECLRDIRRRGHKLVRLRDLLRAASRNLGGQPLP